MPQTRRRTPSPRRARAKPARSRRRQTAGTIRLYLIEDQLNFVDALRTSPALPAHNIKLVGTSPRNFPDLPKRVSRAKADVVLIDINLGPARKLQEVDVGDPLHNGLAACETLKRNVSNIRIVVWSVFKDAKESALAAGADHFFEDRNPSLATVLQTIKRVARNQPVMTRSSTAAVGRVVGLRLMTRDRRLTAEDAAGGTASVKLKPVGFALVWYLALERLAGSSGWLRPEYPSRDLVYLIEKPGVWRHICAAAGVAGHNDVIPNTILNNWKTGVRESLRIYGKIELFGSSQGRPSRPPHCSLVPSITQTAINIDDPDSVTQALVGAAGEHGAR